MKWTDRIRQIKIILVIAAVLIAVVSLLVSHRLVRDLASEEHNKVSVWAEAMRSLNTADAETDLTLVLKVLDGNSTIPVIVTDEGGNVQFFRNVKLSASTKNDSLMQAHQLAKRMAEDGKLIRIQLGNNSSDGYINVCYDESIMLKRLTAWPYVQLGVVMLFVVVAIFALLTSKRAEQNKVWVGLSKETAHQLGTPVSSLMAWAEILKEQYPDDKLIPEMGNDIKRLELITERFSKIGSLPELQECDLNTVLRNVIDYMNRRTSTHVDFVEQLPQQPTLVKINASLFEWVVENLCKNAVDAIDGNGVITVRLLREGQKTIVEVEDNGRGIRKKDISNVFRPGFTTKKRGWGLGLSLCHRIVEDYHHGRIYVKFSTLNVGTCFRIEL